MSFLDEFLKGAANFMHESIYAITISSWTSMSLNDAANAINEFIYASPENVVRKMDSKLLENSVMRVDFDERKKSIKLYVIFKMQETEKHRRFIGFPEDEEEDED